MAAFFPVPLLLLCLLGGVVLSGLWYFGRGKANRPSLAAVVAVPIGCVAVPIAGVVLLVVAGALFQKSDASLAEEVFGQATTVSDDRMLFDDFGRGRTREIYMRAEMTETERARLLPRGDAVESADALAAFEARGAGKGFMWWVSTDPQSINYCRSARIRDARGYQGWDEFSFATCLDAGPEFPQSSNAGNIYLIARRAR